MVYTVVPTVFTSDTWTAANHNLYIKDNFAHVEAQGEGEETVYIPAGAMWAQPASEPHPLKLIDTGTLSVMAVPFDKDTDAFLNFVLGLPKRYDAGTIWVQFWWTSEAITAGSVVWQIAMNMLDDDDALGIDPVAGLANVTDAWTAVGDIQKTSWVEVTPINALADDNAAMEIQCGRNADHGSDNADDDAALIGVLFRWTADVEMDD